MSNFSFFHNVFNPLSVYYFIEIYYIVFKMFSNSSAADCDVCRGTLIVCTYVKGPGLQMELTHWNVETSAHISNIDNKESINSSKLF